MTIVTAERYAYTVDKEVPVQETTYYALAGTEGTQEDDPRVETLDLGFGTLDYIKLRVDNLLDVPVTHTLLPDPSGLILVRDAYDATLDSNQADRIVANEAVLASATAQQTDAYDELIAATFTDPSSRYIARIDYP